MKIALVGIGKIARDQHIPAIAASSDWELAATVSRAGTVDGVEAFTDFEAFLAARPDVPVVSLCVPPVPRFAYARAALQAGRHVMLEKPPGATLAEVHALQDLMSERSNSGQNSAGSPQQSLFATWHSRMAAGVAPARAWLSGRTITGGQINWREDVRRWHPGQDWVFEPGGMGVFDPGINALSILTEILPEPAHLTGGALETPANRQTPIGAKLTFSNGIVADFDWRQSGPQTWDIVIETDEGTIRLSDGGHTFWIDDEKQQLADHRGEYPALYARMSELVAKGQSDVDLAPMVHVADAMTLARRDIVDAFDF